MPEQCYEDSTKIESNATAHDSGTMRRTHKKEETYRSADNQRQRRPQKTKNWETNPKIGEKCTTIETNWREWIASRANKGRGQKVRICAAEKSYFLRNQYRKRLLRFVGYVLVRSFSYQKKRLNAVHYYIRHGLGTRIKRLSNCMHSTNVWWKVIELHWTNFGRSRNHCIWLPLNRMCYWCRLQLKAPLQHRPSTTICHQLSIVPNICISFCAWMQY